MEGLVFMQDAWRAKERQRRRGRGPLCESLCPQPLTPRLPQLHTLGPALGTGKASHPLLSCPQPGVLPAGQWCPLRSDLIWYWP